jgi:hypothetical protein
MMSMRATGLCLVAVFVVMGATAVSASAVARPQFQVENKKTGVFEPVKKPVAFKETGGVSTVRSDSGVELTCASSSGKGKLTGPKSLTVKTTFSGCETPASTKCQSGKVPGEIKSSKLEGTLVYATKGSSLIPAIDLSPSSASASMLRYKCGATKVTISGHVLGEITPLDESTTEMTLTFAEGEEPEPGCGTQEIQLIEGIGPCRHLEIEPEPAAKKKPIEKTETSKKEYVGHVSLLK